MTVDRTKLGFYSGDPIEKIVQEDTLSYTVAAGTPSDIPPYPGVLKTVTNTYGKKCLSSVSWSIDGSNFNSSRDSINYTNGTLHELVTKASVNCGVYATTVYFYIVNNYTSSLTFTINYALKTIS